MRNYLCGNRLCRDTRRERRRQAFSLAELVVAIGVLLLLFSLAGQVFNLTIKSTGQAKALTEVSQLLRIFERTLRDDLRSVQPGQSLILIQGNPVNAYWTQEEKEADDDGNPADGYPHVSDPVREDAAGHLVAPRADMLMFFTARRGTSFISPNVTSGLQQVVYGHAELGDYALSTSTPGTYDYQAGPTAFPLDPDTHYPSDKEVSPVPAAQWHLARRSVLLVPNDDDNNPATLSPELGDPTMLTGASDVVWDFSYEQHVMTPGAAPPWYLPDIFTGVTNPISRSLLDPAPPAPLAQRLGQYLVPRCASFKVEWMLDPRSEFVDGRLDRATEIYWFDPGDPGGRPLAALQDALDRAVDLGQDALAGDLNSLLNDTTLHPDGLSYSLMDRFGGTPTGWPVLAPDGRGNLIVFGISRRNLGPDGEPATADDVIVQEDIFPSALRITIDVYDREHRLDRPIRHVMVVPVGG